MDYRPISLLQTENNVFAKVLATRVQLSLPRVNSDLQQGFVHGRRMTKTVMVMMMMMMMMAQLTTATEQPNLTAEDSRCILLLDFWKAYDTVDRNFLYETLRIFGFNESFVDLIYRIHTRTQLVSSSMEVGLPRFRYVPVYVKTARSLPSSFSLSWRFRVRPQAGTISSGIVCAWGRRPEPSVFGIRGQFNTLFGAGEVNFPCYRYHSGVWSFVRPS